MLSFVSLILLHPYIFRWNCSSSFRLLISVWRGQVSSETKWNWRYVAFDAHAAPEYIATNSVSSQNLGWHRANREVLGPFHTSSGGWDSWRSCSGWWSNSVRSSWGTTANQLIDLIPYRLQMGFSLTFVFFSIHLLGGNFLFQAWWLTGLGTSPNWPYQLDFCCLEKSSPQSAYKHMISMAYPAEF